MTQETMVTDYEVMFTVHTGVTVLMPRTDAFNKASANNLAFQIQAEEDITIDTPNETIVIKNLKKDYLDEASERGFIMFYELEDDEVVRCTPCQILS